MNKGTSRVGVVMRGGMMKGNARSALVTIEATSRTCLVEVGMKPSRSCWRRLEDSFIEGIGGKVTTVKRLSWMESRRVVTWFKGNCTGRAGASVGGLLRV